MVTRHAKAACLGLVAIVAASCDPAASDSVLESAFQDDPAYERLVEFLAVGPRPAGSEGAKKAAAWLENEAAELGWHVETVEWTESTDSGRMTFRNVVARLGDDDKPFIVLGSHYDTKRLPEIPDFIGANDSGSSTAVLLEIMRILAENQNRLDTTVECVFFDGEECVENYGDRDGLHGSRHHVERLRKTGRIEQCRAMILLDMIGDRDLRLTVPQDSDPKLKRLLFRVADRQGVRQHVGYFRGGTILDDHVPFAQAGIPAINLIDFDFGPNNAYWHTAEDRLENVSASSLGIVGRLTLGMIAELCGD